MSILEDAGPVPVVVCDRGETAAVRTGGERRIPQRQPLVRRPSGLARGLVAGAAVALVALVASPATAAVSTITEPSGCHHQPGIECPGGPGPITSITR